jgi:hypothetical protein
MNAAALESPPRVPAWCFQYYPFSREGGDFCPFFGAGGYYRNPVNWEGLKSRNFYLAFELPKMAIYRIVNRKPRVISVGVYLGGACPVRLCEAWS